MSRRAAARAGEPPTKRKRGAGAGASAAASADANQFDVPRGLFPDEDSSELSDAPPAPALAKRSKVERRGGGDAAGAAAAAAAAANSTRNWAAAEPLPTRLPQSCRTAAESVFKKRTCRGPRGGHCIPPPGRPD